MSETRRRPGRASLLDRSSKGSRSFLRPDGTSAALPRRGQHWVALVPLAAIAQGCASAPSAPSGGGGSGGSGGDTQTDSGGGGQGGQAGQGGAGGLGGSGGQGGQGGAGGATGDGGGDAVASAEGGDAATLALSDGFESDTPGSPPSSSLWTLIGTAGCEGVGALNPTVIYPITVDNTQHHTGANSVKIMGGDACGPVMLNTTAFSKLTGADVYGRFWVFLLATNPITFDHAALAAIGLTPVTSASPFNPQTQSSYLQLASEGAGNATNVFMWQTTDGDILPDKNTAGGATSTYPAASTWTCVEFHTSTAGALETWVNAPNLTSPPVTGLTFIPGTTATTTTNNQWTPPSVDGGRFAPTSFGLGWIVFSGPMTNLWFDDVALADSRIGCD